MLNVFVAGAVPKPVLTTGFVVAPKPDGAGAVPKPVLTTGFVVAPRPDGAVYAPNVPELYVIVLGVVIPCGVIFNL